MDGSVSRSKDAFTAVGIAAEFTRILADADIGVLVVSTYDTDYVLLKREALRGAIDALRAAGHAVAE